MSGKHQTIQRGKGDNPPEATAEPPKKVKVKNHQNKKKKARRKQQHIK